MPGELLSRGPAMFNTWMLLPFSQWIISRAVCASLKCKRYNGLWRWFASKIVVLVPWSMNRSTKTSVPSLPSILSFVRSLYVLVAVSVSGYLSAITPSSAILPLGQ